MKRRFASLLRRWADSLARESYAEAVEAIYRDNLHDPRPFSPAEIRAITQVVREMREQSGPALTRRLRRVR